MLIAVTPIFAQDYLDINFFIEPKFEHEKINMVNFLTKNIRNDSIRQVNAFAGKILAEPQSDSLLISFINSLAPEIISPVDFRFEEKDLHVPLLITNIESDSIPTVKTKIIEVDSFKVGIFSVYTPDFSVKNKIADHAELDTNIFQIAKEYSEFLSAKTDLVIMLSNVGKYIDGDIVKGSEIDCVVSFDYQKKRNTTFSNDSKFYSILTNKGFYGKLRVFYNNAKISFNWIPTKFSY